MVDNPVIVELIMLNTGLFAVEKEIYVQMTTMIREMLRID